MRVTSCLKVGDKRGVHTQSLLKYKIMYYVHMEDHGESAASETIKQHMSDHILYIERAEAILAEVREGLDIKKRSVTGWDAGGVVSDG